MDIINGKGKVNKRNYLISWFKQYFFLLIKFIQVRERNKYVWKYLIAPHIRKNYSNKEIILFSQEGYGEILFFISINMQWKKGKRRKGKDYEGGLNIQLWIAAIKKKSDTTVRL